MKASDEASLGGRSSLAQKQNTSQKARCFVLDGSAGGLIVTPSKGLFRCMASQCGKTGNAIQFVQWHDGLSFRHAFELLANGGKAAFAQSNGQAKKTTVPKLPCPLDPQGEEAKVLSQVIDFYHTRLMTTHGTSALKYLESRGLKDERLITEFKLGLSDRSLGLRIPHNNRKEGEELRSKLKTLGVYRENGREHLRGCLTAPRADLRPPDRSESPEG